MGRFTLGFFSGFLFSVVFLSAFGFPVQKERVVASVTQVIDGDTFKANLNGATVVVRVIGYDAPERGQPFSDAATNFLKALLEGRKVILETDVQRTDRYGRRLYHVFIPEVLLSELMLLVGLGQQMTIPPNVRYANALTEAGRKARRIGLGIWAEKPFPVPFPQIAVYVGNKRTGVFHHAGCQWAGRISPRNLIFFQDRWEAIRQGFRPCRVCNP